MASSIVSPEKKEKIPEKKERSYILRKEMAGKTKFTKRKIVYTIPKSKMYRSNMILFVKSTKKIKEIHLYIDGNKYDVNFPEVLLDNKKYDAVVIGGGFSTFKLDFEILRKQARKLAEEGKGDKKSERIATVEEQMKNLSAIPHFSTSGDDHPTEMKDILDNTLCTGDTNFSIHIPDTKIYPAEILVIEEYYDISHNGSHGDSKEIGGDGEKVISSFMQRML